MHSQSANFGKFEVNSLNLAPFLLLNPVALLTSQHKEDQTREQFGGKLAINFEKAPYLGGISPNISHFETQKGPNHRTLL